MNIKQRTIFKWSLIVGVPALLLLSGAWYVSARLLWSAEYNQSSPQKIFQEVTGEPVPAGVANLRVAARHFFIKRWVRMRFQATDKAIQKMVERHGRDAYDQTAKRRALQGRGWTASHKYEDLDRNAIGWNAVANIRKPQVYEFSSDSYSWMGDMIVDRQNHTVYIQVGRE